MKINIRKSDARFIVNPAKRKVVCIIDNTDDLFIDFAEDHNAFFESLYLPNKLFKKLKMPNRFIGIATCSPEDEWDEEKGRLIAFSRAKDSLNQSFFKRANFLIDTFDIWLNGLVERINNYGDKVSFNTERRHNRISEILDNK